MCLHIHRQKLCGQKLPVNLKPHCHTYTKNPQGTHHSLTHTGVK